MPTPRLLLINGASGSGKTTVAEALAPQIEDAYWIHPDGLWSATPTMTSEVVLVRAAELALQQRSRSLCIIDCQIRPSRVSETLQSLGSPQWINVLLTCPRELRERRLSQRGGYVWRAAELDTIDNWARILLAEALGRGDLVADSSVESVADICGRVKQLLEAEMARGRA